MNTPINPKIVKEYYDLIYRKKKDKSMNAYPYYLKFINLLNIQKDKKLLDVACGTGFLLKAAEKKGAKTYGIDISKEGVAIARKIARKSRINVGRGEDLPFNDDFFDYITCNGSLEHFLNIPKGIKEMVRVGNNNARFCIVVPNRNYFGWLFKLKKGTSQRDIKEALFSLKEWKQILQKNGLTIKSIHQDTWFMKEICLFQDYNPVNILFRLMRLCIWKILPLELTYQFIFICTKKAKS